MTCWCWSSFWIGVAVPYAVALIVFILCILTARKVDEHGNPIVKVRDAG